MSRLLSSIFIVTVGFLASCYKPQLGDGPGYYCHEVDKPACPDGQTCIGGRCYSKAPSGVDLAMSGGQDGSGGNHDFATGNHDMSMGGQPDFSNPNPDLSSGGMPPCVCNPACSVLCFGNNCCDFNEALGLCTADPTCMPAP